VRKGVRADVKYMIEWSLMTGGLMLYRRVCGTIDRKYRHRYHLNLSFTYDWRRDDLDSDMNVAYLSITTHATPWYLPPRGNQRM
jgi:hypothetical protein